MAAPRTKQKAIELLWIVGAAAVALVVISLALAIAARFLGSSPSNVVEYVVGVLAAVGGGFFGHQTFKARNKREEG